MIKQIKQCVIGINWQFGYAELWRSTPEKIVEFMKTFNGRYDRWEIVPDDRWYKATIYDFDKDVTFTTHKGTPVTVLRVNIMKGYNPYVERRFFGKKKGL